jgi:acyl-coenzyme A thioesterase PaaI-like protein
MRQSIGPALRKYWKAFAVYPGGRWLFSRLLGWFVPYTGSIGAQIELLQPGHGIIVLKEHRKVRNHLKSVHAIALVNLAEMATGLTLMNSLPDNTRGILVDIEMQFLKKARGRLSAECHCDIPPDNSQQEVQLDGEIKNAQGEVVATARANWLIGPEK